MSYAESNDTVIMKLRNIIPITRIVPGAAFVWQTTVKGGRALGAALARVLHLRDGGLTSRWFLVTMSFAKTVVRLQRQGGWVYVVKYLKACKVLLQQAAGGQRIPRTQDLGCAVARTRAGGIPRIIPKVHRPAILAGDVWTIRIWLTLLNLYTVIEVPGKLKLSPILKPSTMDPGFLREWVTFLVLFFPVLLAEIGMESRSRAWLAIGRSLRKEETSAMHPGEVLTSYVARLTADSIPSRWKGIFGSLRPSLFPILKSSPNAGGVSSTDPLEQVIRKDKSGKKVTWRHTSIGVIFADVCVWIDHDLYPLLQEWLKVVDDRVLSQIIYAGRKVIFRIRDANSANPRWPGSAPASTNESYRYDQKLYPTGKPLATDYYGFGRISGELGKLGYKIEPAGKIRVFAMVDCLTQMLMKPVHDILFGILRKIPQDGTFDQMAPAKRLVAAGHSHFWSYDLTAATDRFPVALEQAVMGFVLTPRLAELWALLLVKRGYIVPSRTPDGKRIRPDVDLRGVNVIHYGAGQPQGALTSWAAFSLSHHILVQYAHYKATGIVGWFKDYALLGDDIVLANRVVAEAYLVLLRKIGVECGLAKSMISSTASFEFAKRTFVRGKDVSPISLLAIGAAKADFPVLEQILQRSRSNRPLMETLRVAARVIGYGYRSLARLPAVLAKRSYLQGLAILLTRPGSPWGLEVTHWLLQRQPGVIRELSQEGLRVIGDSLWTRLVSSMTKSVEAHLQGYESTLKGTILDPSQKSSEWLDPGNWVRDQFDLYVRAPLLAEVKEQLVKVQDRASSMVSPSLEDLNKIWLEVEELRDILDCIPVKPNYFARMTESFGAGKRSATIRLWNAISNLVVRTALPLETELCRSRHSAICVGSGLGTPMESDAILEARIQDPPIESNLDLSPGPPQGGRPLEEVVEVGEAVSRSPDSQSAPAEWETIALEADF
jgi:hypothetical protein